MKAKKVRSRNQGLNKVNLIIEADEKTAELLKREISKAIHRANRQTTEKIGYEMLLINRNSNLQESSDIDIDRVVERVTHRIQERLSERNEESSC